MIFILNSFMIQHLFPSKFVFKPSILLQYPFLKSQRIQVILLLILLFMYFAFRFHILIVNINIFPSIIRISTLQSNYFSHLTNYLYVILPINYQMNIYQLQTFLFYRTQIKQIINHHVLLIITISNQLQMIIHALRDLN